MTCPRCHQDEITDTLIHLRLTPAAGGTTWIASYPLCTLCEEDVMWFIVHRTIRRPELCAV